MSAAPRGPIKCYRDLEVWQEAMSFVVEVYAATSSMPSHERYGLCAQLQRAAVSTAANIAEGHGREHLGDYIRFLSVASGSLAEAETEILVAKRLAYLPPDVADALLERAAQVGRRLGALIRALKRRAEMLAATAAQDRRPRHPAPGT